MAKSKVDNFNEDISREMLMQMHEALTFEMMGFEIDLCPPGCHFRKDAEDDFTVNLFLPVFAVNTPIVVTWFLDAKGDLTYVQVIQQGYYITLTDDEEQVLGDAWEWFIVEKRALWLP